MFNKFGVHQCQALWDFDLHLSFSWPSSDYTLGRKANSKNFLSQTSAIPIRNPEDMWIPKMCDIKSVHGPHFELWAKMWFLMQKYGLKLKVLNVSCLCNSFFMNCLIIWVFPQDGLMLVDGVRHQNFGIWTNFGWVIAFLAKKNLICLFYCI